MEITAKRYKKVKSIITGCQALLGTTDPFAICKLLDFKICYIPLSDGIYGFNDVSSKIAASLKSQDETLNSIKATIFLSDKLDYYRQKIVCAHELGHIFLQYKERLNLFDAKNSENNLSEYEANLFAIELMPQIYHIKSVDYRSLNKKELQEFMNKKITDTFITI